MHVYQPIIAPTPITKDEHVGLSTLPILVNMEQDPPQPGDTLHP